MEETLINTISSLGAPAALCAYLLVKMNGTMERLTEAINRMNSDIERRQSETQHRLERVEEIVLQLEQNARDIHLARRVAREAHDEILEHR